MTRLPAVTAVIPTHNRPDQMRRALESVLTQNYDGDIEVIVVFDAEEPYRPEVEVPPGRSLKTIVNNRSRGLAGARNSGILAAANEYVAFLDDDDWWFPGKLARQMPAFAPDTLLVGSAMVLDDGEHRHERLIPVPEVTHAVLLRDRIAGLHSSTFVFRRDALLGDLGLVDENLPGSYGEDYDLLLRTSGLGRIDVINEPLVSVTWSQNSYFFGKWGAYAEGLEYLLNTHAGFKNDRKAYARIAGQIAFARAANGDRRTARQWVRTSLSRNPTQIKAWLALGISLHLLSTKWVVGTVQRLGKGI
ncbi:glycosyltransferase family 2 protein [Propionicimonas sp.]|uniref:glycosyltransferase family 2 protein n=1 Tax=Propionicimonas sp. TaxID=1955623 RepID=UPI0039E3013E